MISGFAAITGPPLGLVDGRVVGVLTHLGGPLMLGKMRPVESVVKPSRRYTKARMEMARCGPWHYHRTKVESQRQYVGRARLSRPVVKGVNCGCH